MMTILKRGIDAVRAPRPTAPVFAHPGPDGQAGPARDARDEAEDDRDRARHCEGMFYWGMAGGPWY